MKGRETTVRRRGSVLIYQLVALLTGIALASLAVDVGRVEWIKMQLRCAADAAALAATDAMQSGNLDPTAIAIAAAAANSAAGSPVVILAGDVEYGHWNVATSAFVVAGLPIDSVRVSARRVAARGSAVTLLFGNIVGQYTCDVNGQAVSHINAQIPNYAFAAANQFISRGLLTTDSYPATGSGNVYANADITLNLLGEAGMTLIDGDCRPGGTIHRPMVGLTNITGSTSTLSPLMSFPPVDDSDYVAKNNNAALPSTMIDGYGNFTTVIGAEIPAGTYVVNNFTVAAGLNLRLDGPTTFYVNGATNIAATIQTPGNDATQLKIRVVGGGAVNIAAGLNLYMDLYAPQSTINLAAGGNYYGALAGNQVNVLGSAFMHYQTALARQRLPSSSLVN